MVCALSVLHQMIAVTSKLFSILFVVPFRMDAIELNVNLFDLFDVKSNYDVSFGWTHAA
jgi:hypothetical protein